MASTSYKRKRDNGPQRRSNNAEDESGWDGISNQTLPVAELPPDFDGIPLDGSTYLAMVRREAASHPSIFLAAHNPYAEEARGSNMAQDKSLNLLPDAAQTLDIPSPEWRRVFLERFLALREAISLTPATTGSDRNAFAGGRVPKARSGDLGNKAWFKYIFRRDRPTNEDGEVLLDDDEDHQHEESEAHNADGDLESAPAEAPSRPPQDSASQNSTAVQPNPDVLARFTTKQILSLLSHLPYWITIPLSEHERKDTFTQSALPPILSQWCFATLAKLDTRLVSDEISILRTLARACIASIALRRRRLTASAQVNVEGKAISRSAETGAWIVVAIVAGLWGQSDLWEAAEQDLASVSPAWPPL